VKLDGIAPGASVQPDGERSKQRIREDPIPVRQETPSEADEEHRECRERLFQSANYAAKFC
jgi:hypothetical protein